MASGNPQSFNLADAAARGPKVASLIIRAFAVLPLLIGFGVLVGAGFSTYSSYQVGKYWPSVDAVVAGSRLDQDVETTRDASDENKTHTLTVYKALIEFKYTLDGREYKTPVGADYASSNYVEMQHKVDVYAPGTHHSIRCNPANPHDIRYEVSATFGYYKVDVIMAAFGLIAFSFGTVLFIVGQKMSRARPTCPSCGIMIPGGASTCPNCGMALAVISAPDPTPPGMPTPGT